MKTQMTQTKDNKTPESDNQRNETRPDYRKYPYGTVMKDGILRAATVEEWQLSRKRDAAAPAQAQHSPLPHLKETFRPRMDVVLDKMRANIVPELSMCIIAEHYDNLQAHAQRLADALTEIKTVCYRLDNAKEAADMAGQIACEALAEWSKQK